jgi:uncharacterized protein (TIGR01777 family)
MRIVIPGGSGQVGTLLARAFVAAGDEVVVLSRTPKDAPWRTVAWDGKTLGDWARELDGADVVINLAGLSVNCRYTPENRRLIMESRIDSVRVVGEAIARAAAPPRTWLQASTATIYAHRYDAANDERSGIIGGNEPDAPDTWNFSIDVATSWERALDEALVPATRKVKLRAAMVMSPDRGGVFDTLYTLVRRGLGGNVGDGRQFVSWIHEYDFIHAVRWLIEHEEIDGAVNLAAPNPLPYSEFVRAMRSAAGQRIGLPATKWMLEIASFFMRTESELVLKSRRVVPGRLLEGGFVFEYPEWPDASRELAARHRSMSAASPVKSANS